MRERVAVYGGTLDAGPVAGGGLPGRAPTCPTPDVGRAHDPGRGGRRPGAGAQRLHACCCGPADDIEVVGEAADGAEAVELVAAGAPRRRADGHPHARDGRARGDPAHHWPTADATRVLILTTFDLDEYVYEALRAGASGFLLKDTLPDELLAAVRVVAAGEALLAPKITPRLIEEFVQTARGAARGDPHPGLETLTEREREVLGAVARGLSNAEIAEELFMSHATAKTHVSRLLTKLHARDRAQLVVIAYESGVVQSGS